MSDEHGIPDEVRDELNRLSREQREQTAARFGIDVGPGFYDMDGKPIGLGDWAQLTEDFSYGRVAEDYVGPYRISTIWLGLDHGFSELTGGPPIPLIFETMVFLDELRKHKSWPGEYHPSLERDEDGMARYSTLEQAQEGHAETVRRWQEKLERARRQEHET